MMQISDSSNQKKSLFNAMNRFIVAVNTMDQTVMVPSLLRDVPQDHDLKEAEPTPSTTATEGAGYFQQADGDMYSSYVLLKSIRNDIECGVLQGDEWHRERVDVVAVVDEDDLEKQLHFHLDGLHAVLSKLTRKANTLTSRYKEEIGVLAR